ncbi:hypothetical protein CKQ90_34550, partial [Klebsiella pneumoniae]
LHDDFLFTAESIQIGIWDWQVSHDNLQVNDTLHHRSLTRPDAHVTRLHDDFLFTAESIQIGIWDWQVSHDNLQVNDTL